MAAAPTGAYFHPGRATNGSAFKAETRGDGVPAVFVAEPPPFGVGSARFNKHDSGGQGQQGPAYHAAYGSAPLPRWDTKGWSGLDDPIKRGRGTGSGRVFSSMAPPTGGLAAGSTLQPMFATHPNETRLQELLDLQRRRTQGVPAPGTYELPGFNSGRTTFRRPTHPSLDGPFLEPAAVTTRCKEIAASLLPPVHTDVGPGEYAGAESKEATSTLRQPPSVKIGSGTRDGRTPHLHTLSISRSLQHGIDWHIPVIVQARLPNSTSSSSGAGPGKPPPPLAAGRAPGAEPCSDTLQPRASPDQGPQPEHSQHSHHHHAIRAEGSPPRYMEAAPPGSKLPPPGLPPAPPPHVARSVHKQAAQQPGAWNWEALNFNYRNTWTTLHGGAYLQGDRKLRRRTASAPFASAAQQLDAAAAATQQPQQQGGEAEASTAASAYALATFGADSSVDLSSVPLQATSIFPIAEESSAAFREIRGSPGGSRGAPPPLLVGSGGADGPGSPSGTVGSPRRPLTSSQDVARHTAALQAGSAVQQVSLRQSLWAARSGDPAGHSGSAGSSIAAAVT